MTLVKSMSVAHAAEILATLGNRAQQQYTFTELQVGLGVNPRQVRKACIALIDDELIEQPVARGPYNITRLGRSKLAAVRKLSYGRAAH